MNKEEFAEVFIKKFPEYRTVLEEHYRDYGELLGHVFFGDVIDQQLFNLLKTNCDKERIIILFDFINVFYLQGDDDCKNIVIVTILEYLGDDSEVLNQAYKFLKRELIEESILNEKFLGRYWECSELIIIQSLEGLW